MLSDVVGGVLLSDGVGGGKKDTEKLLLWFVEVHLRRSVHAIHRFVVLSVGEVTLVHYGDQWKSGRCNVLYQI